MQRLQIGPIELRIHRCVGLEAWLKPLLPYHGTWSSVPTRLTWDFHVNINTSKPPLARGEHFVFERHQLYFQADEQQRTSHLYTQGEEADFLAGLELTLSLACEQLGGLSIHGAAGAVNACGYLMPGVSGTGKSTAARNAGFECVVGDERVLLIPNDGDWLMFSTPFWSAGRSQCPDRIFHVLDVVLQLDQSERMKISTSTRLNSLEWLLRSVVYYGTDTIKREQQLERAIQVVESAQHFRLGFTKKGPWAWTLNQMHFNCLSTKCEQSISQSTFTGT